MTPGGKAFIDDSEPQICEVSLLHRITHTGVEKFEIIDVEVEGPLLSAEQRCTLATELAAVVEEKLPG
ncbi:MAG: hypothetical protein ACT4NY_24070 [Pseudonocardiales bacterium]